MLTIAKYVELNIIKAWELHGIGLPERTFYYTEGWRKGVAALTPPPPRRMQHSPSPSARIAALVEEFVGGVPFAKLVSPVGSGIDPAFKRMRAPKQVIVTMRTYHTRTFGFFSRPNVFVGVCIALTQILKSRAPGDPDPYLAFFAEVERYTSRLAPAEVDGTSNVEALVFP